MLVACEGSGPSRNGPGDGGGGARDAPMGTSSDGVSIAAANVRQVTEVENVPPASGHILVVIDITLTDAGTKAASLSPAQFSLETSAGVAFIASPLTSEETGACDPSASVEPNAHATCTAVFEVDSSSLSELIYTLADNTTATVSVTLPGAGSGSNSDGDWGAACDSGHPCTAPLQCLVSSGYASTCMPTCTGTNDTSCMTMYAGSGLAACFPTGGSASYCIIECVGGTSQCPGVLECQDDNGSAVAQGSQGFCQPPMD